MIEHKLNMLQQSKDPAFLKCYRARKGHKLVSLDFDSAEDVVLAEFTKDPNLIKIYGPSEAAQCGYLFLAARVPSMQEEVQKIYDPNATRRTKKELAECKRVLKPQRKAIKTAKLALNYNAYPKTIQRNCKAQGFPMPLSDCETIFNTYHATFPGIRQFAAKLEQEVVSTGGYFVNGVGLPMAVERPRKMRDLVNSFCQSSVAGIILTYIKILFRLRTEQGLQWWPWLINFYDEVTLECPEAKAGEVAKMMEHGLALLNQELGPDLPVTGEALTAQTLAEIKQ